MTRIVWELPSGIVLRKQISTTMLRVSKVILTLSALGVEGSSETVRSRFLDNL